MHAVIPSYSGEGAGALMNLIEERKSEVEAMMKSISGFVSYTVVRTDDGGATFTVCDDEAGTDESVRVAREWIRGNASELHASAPSVAEGPVTVHVG